MERITLEREGGSTYKKDLRRVPSKKLKKKHLWETKRRQTEGSERREAVRGLRSEAQGGRTWEAARGL